MNLAAASALNVIAQRGRKAITEKSRIVAHPELHKVLKYQGFHVQSTKPGQSSYIHPKTGAKATVHEDGNWNVTYPKPKELMPKKKLGGKKVSVKAKPAMNKLAKPAKPELKKMKVAAGGPGSGPRPGYERAVMSIQPDSVAKLMERLKPNIARTPKTQYPDETHGWTAEGVYAGGPGSGRHPGAATAREYGWKKQSALGGHLSMYHPNKPSHTLEIEPDGKWVHSTGPGGGANNYIEDQGQGTDSLDKHLSSLNFKPKELRRERRMTEAL